MSFYDVGGSMMHSVLCDCDPHDCPYVQYAKQKGYNHCWYQETGRYTNVHIGYWFYPSYKLPNPKVFCLTCINNNER